MSDYSMTNFMVGNYFFLILLKNSTFLSAPTPLVRLDFFTSEEAEISTPR